MSLSALLLPLFTSAFFSYAPYGQSLLADVHPDFVRMEASSISVNEVYDYNMTGAARKMHTFTVFGISLPVWTASFAEGKYGLSVACSMSANLWMDLFESSTQPIVDTDYRIGGPNITFLCNLDKGFFKNYSIQVCPFKHESTHAGDETVLKGVQRGYALNRVNVTCNYMEYKFTLNEPLSYKEQCHTFRAGIVIPYPFSAGYYFVTEADGQLNQSPGYRIFIDQRKEKYVIGPKVQRPEWYLQYQYQSPCFAKSIQAVASFELRNRAVYGYDLLAKKGAEPTTVKTDSWNYTYNGFVGLRFNGPHSGKHNLSRFSIGFRAYYGNCPYGQFRSITGYSHYGLCLIME